MENNELEQENQLEQIDNKEVTSEPSVTKTNDGYKLDFSKQSKTIENEEQSMQNGGEEQQVQAEVKGNNDSKEEKILEEIVDDESAKEKQTQVDTIIEKKIEEESVKKEIELPENIQKVVDFMKETGGSLEDYVRLNADYSNVNEESLLREYYKQTKSHLSEEEVNFFIEDNFSYDEELDDERDVRRKKLAYKEAVTEAKKFLNTMKEKYYDEVKLTSRLTPEQKEAVEFYNTYKKQLESGQELSSRQKEHFEKVTNEFFGNEFKGFEFKVGDKTYRYNVKDVNTVKQSQSDLLNVFGGYIKDNVLSDAKGYHKALFAASNPDALAAHFYEQGKADAIREATMQAKNINIDGRKTDPGIINTGNVKVKVVDGESSSKLKIKLKNY